MADSTDYTKWLERANQDFRLIEIINRGGIIGLEDSFCYICHQCAEKLLKAFIIKHEKTAPKSHDLLFLLGKCKRYDNRLIELTNSLTALNEYSISARYPIDFDDNRTIEDAKESYDCICKVKHILCLLFQ